MSAGGGPGARPGAPGGPGAGSGARRVLLLWPTATYRAEDFLLAAARAGAEVVVGSDRCPRIADLWRLPELPLDLSDPAAAAAAIVEHARERPLAAVIAVEDATVEIAARACAALGLPHNPPEAARAARNKLAQRERLRASGLPVPRFYPVSADADPRAAAAGAPYPCVIKPLSLSASRGVMRADDPDSFVAAFRRVAALLASPEIRARHDPAAGTLLVEAFVPGREVAVEALLRGGALQVLAIFDKPDPLDGPVFEETIYLTPSRLPAAVQEAIATRTAEAARALGLSEGPVHAEARVNAGGVWVLELAARSIGGLCSRALRFSSGMSLEDVILAHALGRPVPAPLAPGASGVMMIPVPGRGVLRGVRGIDAARAVPGIEDVAITARPGDELVPLPEGSGYPGFLFARGETPDAVEAALREAHRRLAFDLAPTLDVLPGGPARPGSPPQLLRGPDPRVR